jgi:hypothetical protein
MLKIDRQIVDDIRSCGTKEELYVHLQRAVELEHATIPTYLTAMYSLKPGTNAEIAAFVRGIVVEEMLHMTISANTLVAIGGRPQINNPQFVPNYPNYLPMGIGHDLVVPIKAFSKELVHDVFMVIEEPEHPIPIMALAATEPQYATIGEFYAAIKAKIRELGDDIFVVGPEQQVLAWFDRDRLFPIVDATSAERAIDIIVVEGEGTSTDPFEVPGQPAHYYRFGEIYHGKQIVKTADGYAYSGAPLPFDPAGVYPMVDNPTPDLYPPGSQVKMLSDTFTYSYSCLLNALQEAFNGRPATINAVMGLMFQLRLQSQTLMATPIPNGGGKTAGPVFRYVWGQ